jgi:hypothetical protein
MIQEFFSADIAHTRTEKVISDKLGKSLKQIFQCFITPSMDKGKFQVSVPEGDLLDNDDVKDYLKGLGYTIEYRQCGMNEYEYIIKW